ncbi:MAG: prolipoprotein diacylglyceryl transferase [bacterium]|nr:prolipoprotein diacylglyceryl transferase [bacterium]MDT8395330.1 prolipoprotein diacylglyceryl transferase [bacterium]
MNPELFHLGPLTVHTYGMFYALGILAAVGLAEHLHRRDGGTPGIIADMAFPVVTGVFLGARTLFVLVEHEYYLRHPIEVLMVWKGGLVFYGGFIGGALAFIVTVRIRKLDLWDLADSVAPGIALGHALGRLGCFFAGSCYGRPTDVPWAVTFTDPNSLARDILGIPVHPTQLYSSAFLFFLSAILVIVGRRRRFRGQVFASYVLLYGTFRFFIEFLRGDPRGEAAFAGLTLSTGQWISALLVPAALAGTFYLCRKGKTNSGSREVLLQNRTEAALRQGR